MITLVNIIFFLGCALAVARYYGLATAVQALGAVLVTFGLMRILSRRRIN